ncbi:MAG: MmgE/PrpD family protein [Thalassospira sp.]|uniref:MmgE/PrpD family protein n=1 Tax=Thalassospira sp. TaxID=1912094 RepID=UPI003A8415D4
MESVTTKFAKQTEALTFEKLPSEVVDITKRVIIDGLGCAIGGFNSSTGKSVRDFAQSTGGTPEATLFGTNIKVASSPAILANQAIIRYLDYNDCFDIELGPGHLAGCHPSGSLPVAFAVAEALNSSGKDMIVAIVAGYEVMAELISRYIESLQMNAIHHGSVHAYGSAAIAGKLMGLNTEQIVNAMGIAGSVGAGCDILDAEGEEYNMTKNLADGMLAERGYVGAMLAQRGMTGPTRIIEGHKGFAEALLGGFQNFDMDRPWKFRHHILQTEFKSICTELTTQGHLHATTELVRIHGITPEAIEKVLIRTNLRAVRHCGDPIKKYPQNKETADHSSYFLTAMAILHGKITPKVYEEKYFSNPKVRELIDRTTLEHGEEFDGHQPAAEVTISLKDGAVHKHLASLEEILEVRKTLLTDAGLRAKFIECADGMMSDSEVDRVIEICLNVDKMDNIQDLMKALIITR